MEKRVFIFEVFGNNIVTRNSMASFFEEINSSKYDKIILDFANVTFISRSCADEYIKQKEESKKEVVEVNIFKNVCDMFELVNRQYKKEGIDSFIQIMPKCKNHSLVFN